MSARSFHAGPLGYRPDRSKPALSRHQVRCALEIEHGSGGVDRETFLSASDAEELLGLAAGLVAEILGPAERFASSLSPQHLQAIVATVAQGLLGMRDRDAAGFTLCPLVTRDIRFNRFVEGKELSVDIVTCAAILSFHDGSPAAEGSWLAAHQGLCRVYYEDVVKVFIERRVGSFLTGKSFARLWQAEAYVVAALGASLKELYARFPLDPFQKQCEEWLQASEDPREVLRRIRQTVVGAASRRLDL
jgi:hypothetical protein